MPYKKVVDLPDSVKDHLPKDAQKIYMEAFNNAWDQYSSKEKRVLGGSHEEVSHKVAWSAVKKVYYKNEEGVWVKLK